MEFSAPQRRTSQSPASPGWRAILVASLFLLALPAGCSRQDETPETASSSEAPASSRNRPSQPPSTDAADAASGQATTDETDERSTAGPARPTAPASETIEPPSPNSASPDPDSAPSVLSLDDGSANRPEVDGESKLQLRADLSPEKLREFLNAADQDMETIFRHGDNFSGPQERQAELERIVQLKLQAAQRLASHAEADAAAQTEGKRGELQALSHLASLGDVESAERLEKLANEYAASDDDRLASDSRLVLMGFAIERLQNGRDGAPEQIVQLVDQIARSSSPSDLPAMMVMGQAKQVLEQYEFPDEARHVRDKIIELFADSPDPQVAQMAAQLAGNVRYDGIEPLRAAAVEGEQVEPQRWREAVETLIDESPDLATVRYLAGAALELEGTGRTELAEINYEQLAEHFPDSETAPGQEVELALEARQARQDVLGRVFDPDLPAVGDAEFSIEDYRGQVVLIPFWDSRFPPSMQLIPKLKEIRDGHPEQVAVVGMNLDLEGTDVASFMEEQSLDFPSYRSPSSPTAVVANEVAARFGLVSMPFVVILDREGRVAAIDVTGDNLEQTVEQLLED